MLTIKCVHGKYKSFRLENFVLIELAVMQFDVLTQIKQINQNSWAVLISRMLAQSGHSSGQKHDTLCLLTIGSYQAYSMPRR